MSKQYLIRIIFASLILSMASRSVAHGQTTRSTKPNIIYILADDLGYGDIGPFGQKKIEPPNLDALAKANCLFLIRL